MAGPTRSSTSRLDMIATDVPLVSGDADGWYRVHHLWEEAAERIFSDEDRVGMRRRALELFQRRRETLRTGWSALRWGDARVLGLACRELVHETAGALPIDTAARWLADAPESARATPDLRLLEVALRHARDFDDPRLDGDLDAVVDELPSWRRSSAGRSSPSSSGWRSLTCGAIWPDFSPSTSGPDRCPALTTSQCCVRCAERCAP